MKELVYAIGRRSRILINTSSSDTEGTLDGLVNTGRRKVDHLAAALREAQLCSNDPIARNTAQTMKRAASCTELRATAASFSLRPAVEHVAARDNHVR